MQFLLGTHRPNWLRELNVPLFVSHRTLRPYKRLPVARTVWALDSGGFTELSTYGKWRTTADEYVFAVERYSAEVGNLEWAAPQDWMCEPWIVEQTGLSIREHQERTVSNYLELRDRGPFIPVLQGWTISDYETCIRVYEGAGVDLTVAPVVGLGSVCRRQATDEIGQIVRMIHDSGISAHGFGVKKAGIARYGHLLTSADSMAWSFNARKNPPLPGCTHKNCANCQRWALKWRDQVLAQQGAD